MDVTRDRNSSSTSNERMPWGRGGKGEREG